MEVWKVLEIQTTILRYNLHISNLWKSQRFFFIYPGQYQISKFNHTIVKIYSKRFPHSPKYQGRRCSHSLFRWSASCSGDPASGPWSPCTRSRSVWETRYSYTPPPGSCPAGWPWASLWRSVVILLASPTL